MIVGQRIVLRLKALGISQAELARRVPMSQPGMNNLIAGRSRSTSQLHKIARELQTTPAYLAGEIDDPDEGALPPPPPSAVTLFMEVKLPPEQALAAMFEALLAGIDREAPAAEQALLLAQRLPIGLSQLRELRPSPASNRRLGREEATKALAMHDREPQP